MTYLSEFQYGEFPNGGLAADGKVFRFININNPHAEDRRLRLDSIQLLGG